MNRTSLIRLGGLAAMVVGVLYVLQTYLLWPLVRMSATELNPPWVVYVIIVGFVVLLALGVMAIVALDAQGGGRYGLTAALASLTVAVGAAMVLVGMGMDLDRFSSNLSALILIVGALVVTLGLVALGIVTITARVLPWWCGAALIASPIFALLGPLGGGVPLVLVGYAIFRASTYQTERPSRAR
jgi:hypothetical protein